MDGRSNHRLYGYQHDGSEQSLLPRRERYECTWIIATGREAYEYGSPRTKRCSDEGASAPGAATRADSHFGDVFAAENRSVRLTRNLQREVLVVECEDCPD